MARLTKPARWVAQTHLCVWVPQAQEAPRQADCDYSTHRTGTSTGSCSS
jgi:hypothetical protein